MHFRSDGSWICGSNLQRSDRLRLTVFRFLLGMVIGGVLYIQSWSGRTEKIAYLGLQTLRFAVLPFQTSSS